MRVFRSFLTLLVPGAVALTAAPLWAAEEVNKAAEKAGMPQLDMTYFPGQIFWLAVTFSILYILMKCFALPGVERTQQKRHAVIAAELAAANVANEAAKKAIAEIDKILVDAKTQAVVTEDVSHAAKESIARQAELQRELTQCVHQAEVKIGAARDAALEDVQTSASELANTIIEKMIGMKLQVKS
jgi:F-type H+-transporting ATPase subunit b